jgi:hypothetical protein
MYRYLPYKGYLIEVIRGGFVALFPVKEEEAPSVGSHTYYLAEDGTHRVWKRLADLIEFLESEPPQPPQTLIIPTDLLVPDDLEHYRGQMATIIELTDDLDLVVEIDGYYLTILPWERYQ